jgi:hypothetical protein
MAPSVIRPHAPLQDVASQALQHVVRTLVVPHLQARHARQPVRRGRARARQLAHLLIAADPVPARQLLMQERARDRSTAPLVGSMVEPAARALGDLWQDDECSEVDVAIGLWRLQSAIRLMQAGAMQPNSHLDPAKAHAASTVLVAPVPGELHVLGAALDCDALWQCGWAPHFSSPSTDAALQSQLSQTWFDALDLSLSGAVRREHWLPRVAATIANARRASQNPRLVVVVSGRAFNEIHDATERVGADAKCSSALQVDAVISRELQLVH